jgi:hypothetical protein
MRVLFEINWDLILSHLIYVGLEIPITVVMENSIFWNIIPCSPLKVKRRFGGTCLLNLHECFLFGLFIVPTDGSDVFPETSVDLKRAARSYTPEDMIFHISFRFLIRVCSYSISGWVRFLTRRAAQLAACGPCTRWYPCHWINFSSQGEILFCTILFFQLVRRHGFCVL